MNLYILTLAWKSEKNFVRLVPSMNNAIEVLKEYPGLDHIKWLVRDNDSKDKSIEVLTDTYKGDFFVFRAGHNRDSYSVGNNSLWKISNATDDDVILLLNDDTMIQDCTSFNKMLDLQKKTKAKVVGCRLLYMDTNKLQHAGVIFSSKYGNLPYHFRPGEASDDNAKKDRYFQAVTGACCLVAAEAFNKIGGFNPALKWCFDDIDMNFRIGMLGGKIVYCGSTTIYHEESSSLKKNPVNKLSLNENVQYFRKMWTGKYKIDHYLYLKDPNYMVV